MLLVQMDRQLSCSIVICATHVAVLKNECCLVPSCTPVLESVCGVSNLLHPNLPHQVLGPCVFCSRKFIFRAPNQIHRYAEFIYLPVHRINLPYLHFLTDFENIFARKDRHEGFGEGEEICFKKQKDTEGTSLNIHCMHDFKVSSASMKFLELSF
ncbi:Hypothetical predicted protein [Podarcis lilfordi]|uniref:Uncharacterized protein n=1 Tax=Podarcis lilfordi TaxID=74358 RepID=A0AA35JU50_9SAUR|nr:Hypothetical predicted protein [Podarcis lilfordi]